MIGLDTNILLRAMTQDDPAQSPVARRIMQGLSELSPGHVSVMALAELAWTLDRRYRYSDEQVRTAIETLLTSTSIVVGNRDAVARAVIRSADDGLEFPDALIAELNIGAGCAATLTFDTKAAGSKAFELAR
jgi:predicted nucleic-acid-binding protein